MIPVALENGQTRVAAVAMTSQPTNESELQLYRVLQRANLLAYYDTFICQGEYKRWSYYMNEHHPFPSELLIK
jgi:hypothetical protein